MDFNATIDIIIKDLDETRIIIDDLKKYPGVPVLQVELAKSKCKSAAEVISLLKTLKNNIPEKEKVAVMPEQETDQQSVIKEQIPPISEDIEQKTEADAVTPHMEEQERGRELSEYSASVPEKEDSGKSRKKVSESPILADRFSHLSNSINEKLGGKKGEDDMSDILKTQRLTTLSEAIGVNDRFLFIREIFNGNKDEYNKAIVQLDNVENLTDARAVIMGYTESSDENRAVKQLLDLVKRKLPSNE